MIRMALLERLEPGWEADIRSRKRMAGGSVNDVGLRNLNAVTPETCAHAASDCGHAPHARELEILPRCRTISIFR